MQNNRETNNTTRLNDSLAKGHGSTSIGKASINNSNTSKGVHKSPRDNNKTPTGTKEVNNK